MACWPRPYRPLFNYRSFSTLRSCALVQPSCYLENARILSSRLERKRRRYFFQALRTVNSKLVFLFQISIGFPNNLFCHLELLEIDRVIISDEISFCLIYLLLYEKLRQSKFHFLLYKLFLSISTKTLQFYDIDLYKENS